jgi:hypothetical protein
MTQSTQQIIEAHLDDLETADVRSYQRTPRPFRRRARTKKGRRTVGLAANGRNCSRSTFKSFGTSKKATRLRSVDMQ